jgi:glucose-1-phosphate thymidylyltransferase
MTGLDAIKEPVNTPELVGLVPAAGCASRIQPLPCSKELFPVGFRNTDLPDGAAAKRPLVVSQPLLESMQLAGVRRVYVILRRGKWDIADFYGSGAMVGLDLAYVVTEVPYGAPFSIRQAFGFMPRATVVFGFPDILFQPRNAFERLLARLRERQAQLVLGLFPARDPQKMDMVELKRGNRPRAIHIKPEQSDLIYTWILAVWSPVFTRFMHAYLNEVEPEVHLRYNQCDPGGRPPEYYLGHVIQAALESGMAVESVIFESGRYRDIGTPDDLVRTVREHDTWSWA